MLLKIKSKSNVIESNNANRKLDKNKCELIERLCSDYLLGKESSRKYLETVFAWPNLEKSQVASQAILYIFASTI